MQLVVNKRGSKLTINSGIMEIRVKDQLKKVPGKKVRSILLNNSVIVSTDLLLFAIQEEIDVILMQRSGTPAGRIWSHKFGSISTIRKNQVLFSQSKVGAEWIVGIIKEKINNQSALLLTLSKPDRSTDREIDLAIEKMTKLSAKIDKLEFGIILDIASKLRAHEGNSSRIYFETISKHLPEQYTFERRSQHPAFDMFNSALNYAYGILYNKVESSLVQAGIDPYLGIMHRDEYNRPVFVFDLIEKYRVWADYVIINLCMQQVLFSDFFDTENGVFYLNDHGKRIVVQTFNDYMEEIIRIKGVDRSRNQQILLYAHRIAGILKELKTN